MKIIYVRWLDSAKDDGSWKPMSHDDLAVHEVLICESVGFLLHSDKKSVHLLMNTAGFRNKRIAEQASNAIVIPRCAIRKIKILKK